MHFYYAKEVPIFRMPTVSGAGIAEEKIEHADVLPQQVDRFQTKNLKTCAHYVDITNKCIGSLRTERYWELIQLLGLNCIFR